MIKELNINDSKSYYKLGNELNSNFEKLFNLDKVLNNDNERVIGYYENKKLVGFIHVSISFEVFDIINIIVSNKYRNKGIGTSLLNYLINNYECKELMLEVRESNINAINFYKNNNF